VTVIRPPSGRAAGVVHRNVISMCLIVFAYDCHPKYRLILAANRDEYFARPTRSAEYWSDHPNVLAGRNLARADQERSVGGGYQLSRSAQAGDPPSRGLLAADYLTGNQTQAAFLVEVESRGQRYQGFNLLLDDQSKLLYYSKC